MKKDACSSLIYQLSFYLRLLRYCNYVLYPLWYYVFIYLPFLSEFTSCLYKYVHSPRSLQSQVRSINHNRCHMWGLLWSFRIILPLLLYSCHAQNDNTWLPSFLSCAIRTNAPSSRHIPWPQSPNITAKRNGNMIVV